VIAGEAEEISGLNVVDDFTLEVTLDEPKAYFPYKLAYVTSWIVDRETVEDIEENPIGTGPFKLVRHDEEELMILARNENYYRGYVSLEYVVYLIYQGPSVRLYESGDIDVVYIHEELVERAEDPLDPLYGEVHEAMDLCTHYVVYDVTRPPFDELAVREAFTKAIDKDRFNEVAYDGRSVIAQGLYPPGLPGFNPDVQPVPFDPEQARAALAASSFGGADGLPEIIFTVAGEGGDLHTDDAILLQMWEEVLGVKIVVEQIDYESFYDEIYAGRHGHLLNLGWCADYPDPENFADILLHSEKEQNHGGYNNPELDAMLESARSMMDIEARLALYQEIEQLIVDDMPVAFLTHDHPYYMVTKPYVKGLVNEPIGVAQLMNASIVWDE
jgi:oligopeptide transport system substrate-binding protein